MIISLGDENYLTISNITLWKKILEYIRTEGKYLNILTSHYTKPIANINLHGEILKLIPVINKQDKEVHFLSIDSKYYLKV